ncbi:MAG: winged helix-turn-helix transcriptional regulator [Candidatus Eremiobacteraeota bacterium]|nr:winged helix-turn-helix transcriptional regulator [Candidatus Eremiobacteraeota bacterium]
MNASSDDRIRTDPQTCLSALCSRVAYELNNRYDQALRPIGLRTRDFLLLNTVSDLAPCTIRDIAKSTNLDPASASDALDELVQGHMLSFEAAAGEWGGRRISLTRAGRLKLYEAYPHWCRAQAALLEAFGEDLRRLSQIEFALTEGANST